MFCKDCGKEMKDGTTLCPECGTKTESSNVKQVSNEMPVSDTNMSVIAPEMSKKKYPLKQIWSFDTFELTTDNINNLVKNYKSFIITGKKF